MSNVEYLVFAIYVPIYLGFDSNLLEDATGKTVYLHDLFGLLIGSFYQFFVVTIVSIPLPKEAWNGS